MLVLRAFALAAVCSAATAQYLPDVAGVPIEFACAWRKLAFEYSAGIAPSFDRATVHDALMLGALCNDTRPAQAAAPAAPVPPRSPARRAPAGESAIYVATDGDDAAAGTAAAPKRTVGAGLLATRALAAPKALLIGAGTYYLGVTLEFTPADASLRVAASPGAAGAVWLSGASPLPAAAELAWTAHNVSAGSAGALDEEQGANGQHGCTPGVDNGKGCVCANSTTSASAASAGACKAACQALGAAKCTSYAWNQGGTNQGGAVTTDQPGSLGGWNVNNCCLRTDGFAPHPEAGHVSGRWVGAAKPRNVWKAALPAAFAWPAGFPAQLRLPDNSAAGGGALRRAPRARYPDADPERDQWPVGYELGAAGWLPPKPPASAPRIVNVHNDAIAARGSSDSQNYSGGIGGPCEVFDPPFSYWCSENPKGGGGFQYFVPGGLQHADGTFPDTGGWKDQGKGATVHVWRKSHWANWMVS
jgi:hypothetical protein